MFVTQGEIIHLLEGHPGGTTSVSFSPDGTILASSGYDSLIRKWNATTGSEILASSGHRRGIVAYSPNGSVMVSAGMSEDARILDAATGQTVHVLRQTETAWCCAFTPHSNKFVLFQPDKLLSVWDTGTWKLSEEVTVFSDRVQGVTFSSGSGLSAFALPRGIVQIRRGGIKGNHFFVTDPIAAFSAHRMQCYGLVFSPDDTLMATAGLDQISETAGTSGSDLSYGCQGILKLWDTANWTLGTERILPSAALCVTFSPDGKHIAVGCLDGTIRISEVYPS